MFSGKALHSLEHSAAAPRTSSRDSAFQEIDLFPELAFAQPFGGADCLRSDHFHRGDHPGRLYVGEPDSVHGCGSKPAGAGATPQELRRWSGSRQRGRGSAVLAIEWCRIDGFRRSDHSAGSDRPQRRRVGLHGCPVPGPAGCGSGRAVFFLQDRRQHALLRRARLGRSRGGGEPGHRLYLGGATFAANRADPGGRDRRVGGYHRWSGGWFCWRATH